MIVNIDRPSSFLIHNLDQEITGWIVATKNIRFDALTFTLDEIPLAASFLERVDVQRKFPSFSVKGWHLKLNKDLFELHDKKVFSIGISLGANLLYKKFFYRSNALTDSIKDSPLFFMHIPRTAGTTLRQLIDYVFSDFPRLYIYGDHPGVTTETAYGLNKKFIQTREIIYGHYGFNFKDISETTNPKFITILRNPIDLVNSYLHFQQMPDPRFLDNPLVRHLSGIGYSLPFGGITHDHLDMAIAHARKYFYIIQIEKLQQFSDLLTDAFGLGHFQIPQFNAGTNINMTAAIQPTPKIRIEFDQILFDTFKSESKNFFEFINS